MKLILNVKINEYENANIEILDDRIEEIDKFTTCFKDKSQLFNNIKKFGINSLDGYDFSKYNIYIITSKGNMMPVLYSNYSFITDDLKRRNASIMLMKTNPKRIYEFIENNHYNYLLKDIPKDLDKIYGFDPIYGLSKLILEKNYKIDADYYNYFKKYIEKDYRTLRDLIRYVLNDDERKQLGYNVSLSEEKVNYICSKAYLNLEKRVNEISEKNNRRKYSINSEDDDLED